MAVAEKPRIAEIPDVDVDPVTVDIDRGKIRKQAVAGFNLAHVLEFQLLDDVRDPAGPEANDQ